MSIGRRLYRLELPGERAGRAGMTPAEQAIVSGAESGKHGRWHGEPAERFQVEDPRPVASDGTVDDAAIDQIEPSE